MVRAPFDGTVSQLQPAVSGEKISRDHPVILLADTTRYLAVGDYVTKRDAEKAERIYVFLDGEEYEAEYIPIDPQVYSALMAKNLTPVPALNFFLRSRWNTVIWPALWCSRSRADRCWWRRDWPCGRREPADTVTAGGNRGGRRSIWRRDCMTVCFMRYWEG